MISAFRHNLAMEVCARQLRRAFLRGYDPADDRTRLQFLILGIALFVIVPALMAVSLGFIFGWDSEAMMEWFGKDPLHGGIATGAHIFLFICAVNWIWILPLFLRMVFVFIRDVIEHELINFHGIPRDNLDFLGYGTLFKKARARKKAKGRDSEKSKEIIP